MERKLVFAAAFFLIIMVVGAVVWYNLSPGTNDNNTINTFEECVEKGGAIAESYPRQCLTSDGRRFFESVPDGGQQDMLPIKLIGQITCLPKIGEGVQTLECQIGIQDDNGDYYGLRNLADFDEELQYYQTGKMVEISGILREEEIKGPDGNPYDVVGVIDIESINEAARL